MKVFDITDESGLVFAFEVNNTLLGRSGLCRVVKRIPGASLTKTPAIFSWFREEVFCKFEINNIEFEALEPYGDNSRYWVGPSDPRWVPEIEIVRQTFISSGFTA